MAKISGSGNMTSDLEVETLSTILTGSGYLNFSGKTKRFEIYTKGSCKVKAYALEADAVRLHLSGSGISMVTARKMLKAIVSGSIHYQGNPEKIDIKTSGSGKVFKHKPFKFFSCSTFIDFEILKQFNNIYLVS